MPKPEALEPAGKQSRESIIGALAEWARSDIPGARPELVIDTLERARRVFSARRALLVWEELDEPWVNVACLGEADSLHRTQEPPSTYTPLVPEPLEVSAFQFSRRDGILDGGSPCELSDGEEIVSPQLRERFSIGDFLSLPLDHEAIRGRLFLLEAPSNPDFFSTAGLVAALIEGRFAEEARLEQIEESAVEDRMRRIARDLHDGLLQSFTGIVLQLETLHQELEKDPAKAKKLITELEGVLMNEQRELRSYLESLRPRGATEEMDFDMTGRIRELVERYRSQWGVEVEYHSEKLDPFLKRLIGWETYRIITEAMTNAARHGRAKRIGVWITTGDDHLLMKIADDGEGFSFRGALEGDELVREGLGPRSLAERVSSLNGRLMIESTDHGSTVHVSIPLGWSRR
jgi:signal transduction histidine kinase